jgi:molybdopterin-guanine dinucleotide biosynthesis protein A
MAQREQVGGIVLCGGQSRRMGRAKATLPFGSELMLERVVRILSEVVHPVVVVAAAGQNLPKLPNVRVATDRSPGRGPLEGLAAGMEVLAADVKVAYVTACDAPLLQPGFVRTLVEQLGSFDAVVPVDEQFQHALAAVYRTSILPVVTELLKANQLRPAFLLDRVNTRRVPVEQLRCVDPGLESLMNLNQWDDYVAALKRAGFAPPQ